MVKNTFLFNTKRIYCISTSRKINNFQYPSIPVKESHYFNRYALKKKIVSYRKMKIYSDNKESQKKITAFIYYTRLYVFTKKSDKNLKNANFLHLLFCPILGCAFSGVCYAPKNWPIIHSNQSNLTMAWADHCPILVKSAIRSLTILIFSMLSAQHLLLLTFC